MSPRVGVGFARMGSEAFAARRKGVVARGFCLAAGSDCVDRASEDIARRDCVGRARRNARSEARRILQRCSILREQSIALIMERTRRSEKGMWASGKKQSKGGLWKKTYIADTAGGARHPA